MGVDFDDLLFCGFVGLIGAGAFDVAGGEEVGALCFWDLGEFFWVFAAEIFDDCVDVFRDMEADVAAEIDAVSFAAGGFDEIADGVADNGGVKVADMEDFKGVWVGIFGDDNLVFVGFWGAVGIGLSKNFVQFGDVVGVRDCDIDEAGAGDGCGREFSGDDFGDFARVFTDLFSDLHSDVCGEIAELGVGHG